MKLELRMALLHFAITANVSRIVESPASCFIAGFCAVLGLLLAFISFLPDNLYKSLVYVRVFRNRR